MKTLPIYYYLAFFTGSLLISLLLTPLIRKLAIATGQVAVPKDSRWHKKETALMGGISIFISFMAVWILLVNLMGWESFGLPHLPMILCASGIFALGLADDIFNMVPQHKLACQIVIASILIVFGFRLDWTLYKTVNLFLSIIWIVGITNAFNLLDNMDGLSAGIAFIAGLFLFLMHYMSPVLNPFASPLLLISAIYLGAILGFLVYNFNPASIFMGDAGSLFLGFMLACLTVIGNVDKPAGESVSHLLSVIAIPILILFIPILDTGFVSLMRKLFSRPISQGGRDHSSHRMVAIGFSERKAVLTLYLFAIVSGTIALAINQLNSGISLVVIILYFLFIIFFWIYLAKVKVYPESSILSENDHRIITPILIDITYRRRLFEVFLDLILITVAYYTAYLLRFEGILGGNFDYFLKSLPIIIACQILWFFIMGIYRGVWEKTSLRDLTGYLKAITAGTVMPMLIVVFIYRFQSFSRAVFVIYWILMLILISLSRLSFRLLDEGIRKGNQKGRSTLIYGAGAGGQMAMREIESNRDLGLALVGYIDDNPKLHSKKIQGYPVFGGHDNLEEIIKKYDIKKIIVSFKENGAEKKKEIQNMCLK
ncbi:MAG: glycosyl transferase, partial [Deltaproteobacteria bacterium]|nr:glycosyl transferase [Deltaproteobacteria bacterium]